MQLSAAELFISLVSGLPQGSIEHLLPYSLLVYLFRNEATCCSLLCSWSKVCCPLMGWICICLLYLAHMPWVCTLCCTAPGGCVQSLATLWQPNCRAVGEHRRFCCGRMGCDSLHGWWGPGTPCPPPMCEYHFLVCCGSTVTFVCFAADCQS
jgi:hypothetical protein